jgi:hypothetical protein
MSQLNISVVDQIKHLGKKGMTPRQITKKLRGVMPLKKVPRLKVNKMFFNLTCKFLITFSKLREF